MKKLLIDVNSVVPFYVSGKVNGIGRTTMELVNALAEIKDLPFEIMLYSQNMKGIGGRNMNLPFKNRHLYAPHREKYDRFLSKFPIRELMAGYDIMHIPHNFEYVHSPEKCIVTIHDAMFFSYPEKFLNHDFARTNYPKLASKAKAIITCSENSKKEISYYMNVPEDRIFVCYWGTDHELFNPSKAGLVDITESRPFFLSVSCDIGRKNTISVLKSYEKFFEYSPEHDLVLVWRNPPKEILEKYTSPYYKNKIHFLSNVDNEELSRLYASACATFFPTKYEGFGLPVIESMASGTPVVTCNNSCLPEVGGDAAIYVEPEDVEAMCQWMERFENKSIDLGTLQKDCIAQAAKFTWEKCAQQTVEVYRKCLDL